MSLKDQPYEPPSVAELQDILLWDQKPTGHVNQVWPNLYLGNEVAARDKGTLHSLGITHIVNAAHGPPNPSPGQLYFYVNTGPRFYRDMAVDYYGVEADDAIDFILSPFFYPTARYIRAALGKGVVGPLYAFLHEDDIALPGMFHSVTLNLSISMETTWSTTRSRYRSDLWNGRVFVHCLMGVSRSATLVLSFLMICEGLRLQDAVQAVRAHRDICPNAGFLQQLRSLDKGLERRRRQQAQKLCDTERETDTLSLMALRQMIWSDRKPAEPFNLIWPNLYIGDMSVAQDKPTLSSLCITHLVNAAAGRYRINTCQQFYSDLGIKYFGVEAADHPEFNLAPSFRPSAEFIDRALKENGKVFVHCAMGVSRSGTLVLSFLMICQGLSLVEAIIAVRLNRDIGPNSGFLEQLRQLDMSLRPTT